MEWLLKLVLSALELVLSFRFCSCYLDYKEEVQRTQIIFGVIFLAVAGTIMNTFFVNTVVNLTVSISVIIIVLQCFEGKKSKKTFIGTIYVIFSMVLELTIALFIESLFGGRNIIIEQEGMIMFFMLMIHFVIKFIIIHYLQVTRKKEIQIANAGIYLKQAVIPVISIFFLYYFLRDQLNLKEINYQLCYIVIVVFSIINITLYIIYENTEKLYRINYNNMLLNESLKYKETYYQDVEKHQAEIRMIRHNLKNQLLAIGGVLNQENLEKAKEEIEIIIHEIVQTEAKNFTRNIEVNALLNAKYTEAAEQQIACEFHVNIPERLGLTSGEIGILLGNALDNAIEACVQCEVDKRKIELTLNYHNGCMMIVITNTTKEMVKNLVTKKKNAKDHGFGLVSIENIVKKYQGNMNHKCLADNFCLEITLWNV